MGNDDDGNGTLAPEVAMEYQSFLKKIAGLAEENKFNEAIQSIHDKLKEAEGLKSVIPEVDLRNQLGILQWKNNSFETFLEETASALALSRAHNYKRGIAEALLNLAWVLAMERKDFLKAFDFTEEALEVAEDIGYIKGMATSLYIIATAYKHKKMKEKADHFLQRSLELSMSLAETDLLIPAQQGLSDEERDQLKGALDLL